jgi:hypothetical protein
LNRRIAYRPRPTLRKAMFDQRRRCRTRPLFLTAASAEHER